MSCFESCLHHLLAMNEVYYLIFLRLNFLVFKTGITEPNSHTMNAQCWHIIGSQRMPSTTYKLKEKGL